MNHFVPVKFTARRWAEKLVQGEVFMRALHEFGLWGNVKEKDPAVDNDYRGDFYAGVTATFESPENSDFFKGFPDDFKKNIFNCCLIDESDVQYFKVFSMCCMELDDEPQAFIPPDPRMRQFGDTAVIFIDFCEFLRRFGEAMFGAYDKVLNMIERVEPFSFGKTQYLNPLFCKHESQAYQNELRMAFGELRDNPFSRRLDGQQALALIHDLQPVKMQIGDISDITVVVSADDLIAGKLPGGFRCRWPSSDDPSKPTNFDEIRAFTNEQMKDYRSILVKPTCVMR